ncbi:VTT domain-containing protein [Orrella sp. JC864]|uniref:TVP38/TMEM64 family protein n=1 Tax=Orrella sp. JC864 TaxID=3120298 RepID=UPI00300B2B9F
MRKRLAPGRGRPRRLSARLAGLYRRFAPLATLALAIALVAFVWLATPLRQYMDIEEFTRIAQHLQSLPMTPLVVLAIYVLGSFVLLPISLTIAATGLVLGIWPGLPLALAGTLLAAWANFGAGAALGPQRLRQYAGRRIDAFSQHVARRGVRAVMAVRLVPVAPFLVINLVAGASHIKLRDYLLGTLLGMAPGIVVKVVFADQMAQAARESDTLSLRWLALGVLALVLVFFLVRRRRAGGGIGD